MLTLQRIAVVGEDLRGEIENGKWARNTSGRASRDKSQIPAHNHRDESKTTRNLEIVVCVSQARRSWVEAELVVCGSEKGEQKDEGEEDEYEWDIGPKRSAQEAEGDKSHDNILEFISFACSEIKDLSIFLRSFLVLHCMLVQVHLERHLQCRTRRVQSLDR